MLAVLVYRRRHRSSPCGVQVLTKSPISGAGLPLLAPHSAGMADLCGIPKKLWKCTLRPGMWGPQVMAFQQSRGDTTGQTGHRGRGPLRGRERGEEGFQILAKLAGAGAQEGEGFLRSLSRLG